MAINYLAVLVCSILAMVLGGIWYGPIFGRTWSKIVGVNPDDLQAIKEMQKKAMPLYGLQFLMTLVQVSVLAYFLNTVHEYSALVTSLCIYVGFVLPIVAGSSMWNNESADKAWSRFFIQAGYQLVLFILFALVLGMWQ